MPRSPKTLEAGTTEARQAHADWLPKWHRGATDNTLDGDPSTPAARGHSALATAL
jgi:hypothetical protein